MPAMRNGVISDITAVQPIFQGGQIYNSNKLAKLGTEISKLQVNDSEKDIMLIIEQDFWQLYMLQENMKTVYLLDSMTTKLHAEVKNGVDAGLTNLNELLRVELRKSEIASQRLQLVNGMKTCKAVLSQLMGMDDSNFNIDVEQLSDINPLNEYIDSRAALSQTNKYQLLDKKIEVAQLDENQEFGKTLPKIAVGGSYTYHNLLPADQSSMTYFVKVSIPISDWWGGSHARKQKQIAARMAEYDKQDLSQKMVIEMDNLRNGLDECYQQIQIAKASIQSATENLRLSTGYYTNGLVTMSDLLEAQTLFQQARNKMSESYARYMLKRAEYRKATGR
jgi:outer membrane protein TolC